MEGGGPEAKGGEGRPEGGGTRVEDRGLPRRHGRGKRGRVCPAMRGIPVRGTACPNGAYTRRVEEAGINLVPNLVSRAGNRRTIEDCDPTDIGMWRYG